MNCPSSKFETNRKCLGCGTVLFVVLFEVPPSGPSIPFLINKKKFQRTVQLTHVYPWLLRKVAVCERVQDGGGWAL